MNKAILMGRLTRDPEVRYTGGQEPVCVARYTLAVDRRYKKDEADFISCVAFGKGGEFASSYLHKGTKVIVSGRIQAGNYTNKEGKKVYTTDVIVDEQEFAESKKAAAKDERPETVPEVADGFMKIPDGVESELPFE